MPNVHNVWPEVEGEAATSVFSVLGAVGKTQRVEIVRMSKDTGEWNCHVIVLGAQAQKCFHFYERMENVTYRVDGEHIYDVASGQPIDREAGFGYGLILKARNPFRKNGVAFLIGGFGVLGTAAAAYYFREHFRDLGRDFGEDCFGVVVRASQTAGVEATERLRQFDRRPTSTLGSSPLVVSPPASPLKLPTLQNEILARTTATSIESSGAVKPPSRHGLRKI